MPIIIKHCYNNNLNLKNCVVNSFVKFLVILFENNLYIAFTVLYFAYILS